MGICEDLNCRKQADLYDYTTPTGHRFKLCRECLELRRPDFFEKLPKMLRTAVQN